MVAEVSAAPPPQALAPAQYARHSHSSQPTL
jgi:hypothetical protein